MEEDKELSPKDFSLDEEEKISFLRQEYFYIHSIADSFDQKALTIKAWSVTLSMVGIGIAFKEDKALLFLLSGGASLLFWLIEAYWKANQRAYYQRAKDIEDYMSYILRGTFFVSSKLKEEMERSGGFTFPLITRSWFDARREFKVTDSFCRMHVILPHGVVTLIGIGLWLVNYFSPFM